MASILVDTRSHEIDKIGMAHFYECHNLTLELFRQVVLAQVLSMILELELFDCDIILFISRFENISASSGTDLLFK